MLETLSDKIVEKLKAEFLEAVSATVDLTLQAIEEAAYGIALFGGGITIVLRMLGFNSTKHFWGIQVGFVFIKVMLGDIK